MPRDNNNKCIQPARDRTSKVTPQSITRLLVLGQCSSFATRPVPPPPPVLPRVFHLTPPTSVSRLRAGALPLLIPVIRPLGYWMGFLKSCFWRLGPSNCMSFRRGEMLKGEMDVAGRMQKICTTISMCGGRRRWMPKLSMSRIHVVCKRP